MFGSFEGKNEHTSTCYRNMKLTQLLDKCPAQTGEPGTGAGPAAMDEEPGETLPPSQLHLQTALSLSLSLPIWAFEEACFIYAVVLLLLDCVGSCPFALTCSLLVSAPCRSKSAFGGRRHDVQQILTAQLMECRHL